MNELIFYNEKDEIINHLNLEFEEQILARIYIKKNHTVLELGARYGTVSYAINNKLEKKYNQVSVEPDSRVWDALEKNKNIYKSQYNILKGFISNKKLSLKETENEYNYGVFCEENETSIIPSYTLDEVEKMFNLSFDVLVADCEGYLETFLDENPLLYDQLILIIYEADRPHICNYNKINNMLLNKKFINIENGLQNVWVKNVVHPFFDIDSYIILNNDIIKDKHEALKHYLCHGKYENRNYNFNIKAYKEFNYDIINMNENDAMKHFNDIGKYENRIYNFLHILPDDFDVNRYLELNPDLKNIHIKDIPEHYYYYGQYENRDYK
jgi:hypothetical protein